MFFWKNSKRIVIETIHIKIIVRSVAFVVVNDSQTSVFIGHWRLYYCMFFRARCQTVSLNITDRKYSFFFFYHGRPDKCNKKKNNNGRNSYRGPPCHSQGEGRVTQRTNDGFSLFRIRHNSVGITGVSTFPNDLTIVMWCIIQIKKLFKKY